MNRGGREILSCRAGFTLVELVTVMSVMAMVLTAAILTLHHLRLYAKSHTRMTYATENVLEVARRFRSDVHAASGVAIDADVMTLTTPAGSIRYVADSGTLVRLDVDDRIKRYLVASDGAEFSTDGGLVRMDLRTSGDSPIPWRFAAAIGLLSDMTKVNDGSQANREEEP